MKSKKPHKKLGSADALTEPTAEELAIATREVIESSLMRKRIITEGNFDLIFGFREQLESRKGHAKFEADRVLEIIEKGSVAFEEMDKLPPVSLLAVINIVSRTDAKVATQAKEMWREEQRQRAKRPRKTRHPLYEPAKVLYQKWAVEKGRDFSQADFIRALRKQSNIEFIDNTIYTWIKKWKKDLI